jgi:para-aminobenzoate synthetase component 1
MLSWANRFNIFCFLDNQDYSVHPHQYDCLLAAGAKHHTKSYQLEDLDEFLQQNTGWKFGHLSYELKNSIGKSKSAQTDAVGFPPMFFFTPQFFLQIKAGALVITAEDPEEICKEIFSQKIAADGGVSGVKLQTKLKKDQYLRKINELQKHIVRGDCYEINFCMEFFDEDAVIAPVDIFQKLIAISPNPFSALYKLDQSYLICASPERFLMKNGQRLVSQPMKGTIKRDLTNAKEDEKLKLHLHESAKDQSENVMVVDMVRNDLSKICIDASVKVDELFGVYTYPHVHQMISTISGELKNEIRFSEIIAASFPMGSMTGAPKHRVMELIDQYEESTRGIFSGSVGYINPYNDFDFNVVIRSIMYNASTKYLSCQVGSGITFYSDPEKEWEECMLKAEAIRQVLGAEGSLDV